MDIQANNQNKQNLIQNIANFKLFCFLEKDKYHVISLIWYVQSKEENK